MLNFWLKPHPTPASLLLWPLGRLYGFAAHLHGNCRARHPYYPGVPVISVGNLTVGGAGKTPVVRWLAGHFAAQGHNIAIVSRGYGGTDSTMPLRVDPTLHTAAMVGDEPLELAGSFHHLPVQVWIGHHRPSVARRAEQAGATLLILDDGFQRQDLARTVNILVVDGPTAFGNGQPFPAGPLREFLPARHRATFAVVLNEPTERPNSFYGVPAYRLHTTYAPEALLPLRNRPLIAFSGLARPQKFFESLTAHNLTLLKTVNFPDHHTYTAQNLQNLRTLANAHQATLVTTPKDATKLPPNFATVLTPTLTGEDRENILAEITRHLR